MLRASHLGDEVTLEWGDARALLDGEAFLLLEADDVAAPFTRVNPADDRTLSYTETNTTAPLQLFDLRVGNPCGEVSPDEFPPG